jgi:hypothetical protein
MNRLPEDRSGKAYSGMRFFKNGQKEEQTSRGKITNMAIAALSHAQNNAASVFSKQTVWGLGHRSITTFEPTRTSLPPVSYGHAWEITAF